MKIRVLPYQPHCFAFGGFEMQMLDAMHATRKTGIDVQPLDVWSRDSEFDILHVWGLGEMHLPAVYWAKKTGKRVVMSALLPYLNHKIQLRNVLSRLLGKNSSVQEIVSLLDGLVVVNGAQAETAKALYGIPSDKITVIPNIVSDQYFDPPQTRDLFDFGIQDYLLCVGNVSRRKNQLNVVQAALAAGVPLLLVGPALAGEEVYADELRKIIADRESIRWIDSGLPAGSPELLAAYRGSIGFVLASHNETQPISVLEAATVGKPLLLSDRPWAQQSFYRGAHLVNPDSISSIRAGLEQLRLDRVRHTQPIEILEQCRSQQVGLAYADLFRLVMKC